MPDMPAGNLRNLKVTTSDGKDFRDSQVVQGQAKEGGDFMDTNETTEYRTKMKGVDGAKGGNNTST